MTFLKGMSEGPGPDTDEGLLLEPLPKGTKSPEVIIRSEDFEKEGIKPARPAKSRRRKRNNFWKRRYRRKYFAQEILCLILASVFVIVIAIVLSMFNNKPIAEWRAPLTLNAFVALMTTFLYMLISSPLMAMMAQLKWNSFHKSRKLYDFQASDRASRSTFGALLYMLRGPQSVLGAATSMLLLFNAGLGPLIQQIVGFKTVNLPIAADSTIPVMQRYDTSPPAQFAVDKDKNYFVDLESSSPPDSMINAVQLGIYSDPTTNYDVNYTCPTGNCTFTGYSSLSVASHCANVTSMLRFPSNTDEPWFNAINGSMVSDGMYNVTVLQDNAENLNLLELPNGFQVNLWDAFNNLYPTSFWNYSSDGFLIDPLPWTLKPNGRLATTFTTSLETPLSVNDSPGTFLNLQSIYIEYEYTPAGMYTNYSSWGYGAYLAWECSLSLVNQNMSAQVTDGKINETDTSLAFLGQAGPPQNSSSSSSSSSSAVSAREVVRRNRSNHPIGTDCYFTWPDVRSQSADCVSDVVCCELGNLTMPHLDPSNSSAASVEEYSFIALAVATGQLFGGTAALVGWPSTSLNYTDAATSGSFSFGTSRESDTRLMQLNARSINGSAPGVYTMPMMMDNVARSMTRYMRQAAADPVQGTVFDTDTVYDVAWHWFAIPLLLLLLAGLVVAGVAWDARRKHVPMWTTSSLAVMMHGLDEASRAELIAHPEAEDMHEASKSLRVHLSGEYLMLRA